MEEIMAKTINESASYPQIKAFLRAIHIVTHHTTYTPYAVYEAVESLLLHHGLSRPDIDFLSNKTEWR